MRFNQGRPYPCLAITGQGFFFAGRGLELFPKGSPNEKKEPRPAPRLPVFTGTPGGIRTPDPRLRRPLLYPTELLARGFFRGHCIPGEQEKGKGQGCSQPRPEENGAGFFLRYADAVPRQPDRPSRWRKGAGWRVRGRD